MAQTEDGQSVDPKELWKFHKYIYELANSVTHIEADACSQGMNTDGFTGILDPLEGTCRSLADTVITDAFAFLKERLWGFADTVNTAAKRYGLDDDMIEQGFKEIQKQK